MQVRLESPQINYPLMYPYSTGYVGYAGYYQQTLETGENNSQNQDSLAIGISKTEHGPEPDFLKGEELGIDLRGTAFCEEKLEEMKDICGGLTSKIHQENINPPNLNEESKVVDPVSKTSKSKSLSVESLRQRKKMKPVKKLGSLANIREPLSVRNVNGVCSHNELPGRRGNFLSSLN